MNDLQQKAAQRWAMKNLKHDDTVMGQLIRDRLLYGESFEHRDVRIFKSNDPAAPDKWQTMARPTRDKDAFKRLYLQEPPKPVPKPQQFLEWTAHETVGAANINQSAVNRMFRHTGVPSVIKAKKKRTGNGYVCRAEVAKAMDITPEAAGKILKDSKSLGEIERCGRWWKLKEVDMAQRARAAAIAGQAITQQALSAKHAGATVTGGRRSGKTNALGALGASVVGSAAAAVCKPFIPSAVKP